MDQESGNGWAEGVHPADFDRCLEIFLEAFEQRRRFEMEYRILDQNEDYRWILDHGIPSNDADGIFDGYIGYCFDITDRKLMEQSLNQRQEELERSNRELQHARAELERIALYDKLTGLPNRHSLLARFNVETDRRANDPSALSLLIIDADHFKVINDKYGHLVGDDCLATLASCLSGYVRASDIVSRFGGEEFVVLLPDAGPDTARDIATKLCRRVAQDFPSVSHHGITLTISIGGATVDAGEASDFKTLLGKADAALYKAKALGRNRVVMADTNNL